MIPFNRPYRSIRGAEYMTSAILEKRKLSGDGEFTRNCSEWFEKRFDSPKVLLTTSGTDALEMAALLMDVQAGDEIIMPSYTFVSTANAFVLRGAKIVFVDIRPDTMNIDETLIEQAITPQTKAIVPVHYAGVSCEMNTIKDLAQKYKLQICEDAAQGVMSFYDDKALGTLGELGCYSFHETKNYTMGEGGAILINDPLLIQRAEIIREKGTNRSRFFRGEVDKYTWVDIGSSFLPSDLNAAYLAAQLEEADVINKMRLKVWNHYYQELTPMAAMGFIELPVIPAECRHNAHMFYIKCKNLEERTALSLYLKTEGISTVFHYIPLHSTDFGMKVGYFSGEDRYTTRESERILRLPMFAEITEVEVQTVCDAILRFCRSRR